MIASILRVLARHGFLPLIVIGSLTLGGCSGSSASATSAAGGLPSFHDIVAAPAPIQRAAKAVVRVRTAREAGTGVFVSGDGLLLTNNHVLGELVCPVEGCFVELTFERQVGSPRQDPVVLFAVPVAVDVGLDMALVRVLSAPGGEPHGTNDFLPIVSSDSAALVGTHVTVVGHPEGYLKKWADGVVVDAAGNWFTSTAFILPGDSGSPVLDDSGALVGIIHRGADGGELISSAGVNTFSIGTASAPLIAAMGAPLPPSMISVMAPATADDIVARNIIFANARVPTPTVDGAITRVLSLLASACDSALGKQDLRSPDDLREALLPCYHALTWIDCRSDVSGPKPNYQVECPPSSESMQWTGRYQMMNDRWVGMNGQMDLYPISFGVARLQPTKSAGTDEGALSLQTNLDSVRPPLDFELADYLAAFKILSYAGVDIKGYVQGYRDKPQYALQSAYVAYAAGWLLSDGWLTRDEALSILEALRAGATVSIGTKLYVEDSLYDAGKL